MHTQAITRQWIPRTAELTLAAGLAATYVITTFIPLTPFIGGPAFITLEIVMLPVIAAVLRPIPALATAFVGSLGMALGQPSFYQAFGLPGLLVPMIAAGAGSVAFHYGLGPILPWAYVLAGAAFYIAMTEQVTLNILSISLLSLTGPVWLGITPLMYLERTIATFGGAAGIVALKSAVGGRLDIAKRIRKEVR